MKNNWQTKKLGEIGSIFNGNSINERVKKEKYFGLKNGLAFIATKDVNYDTHKIDYDNGVKIPTNEKGFKVAHKNSVLICAEGGSAGKKVAFNDKDICFGNKLFAFEPFDGVDSRFVYYWYLAPDFSKLFKSQMNGLIGGVSINSFKNIEIMIPSNSEQKRIVKKLDEIFEKVTKAKEAAEKNLQNAEELFESYLQSVFTNKGKDWEEKKLGDVLEKTETVDPTKKPKEKFIYIDVSSVNKETKEIENTTILVGKDAPSRARKLIKTNDVIFATVRPTHRRVALITEEYNNQVCSTGYFVLRARESLNNNLVYYFLLTHDFNRQMEKVQKGASYPAVTDGEVKSIIISFPKSLLEQKTLVTKLNELSIEANKLEAIYDKKLLDLEELKKSVLKRAFNGDL